jgi:hypothetical protein
MWHFKCSIIEMRNIKKKRKNTLKLITNLWPQINSLMCTHKKGPQALSLSVTPPALLPETTSWWQPGTLGRGLPKPLQVVSFLWPMGTLENGLPPGSEPLAFDAPYCPRNPISSIVRMRRPGPLSPSSKHCGVQGAQGNGDSGRPTDNLCG